MRCEEWHRSNAGRGRSCVKENREWIRWSRSCCGSQSFSQAGRKRESGKLCWRDLGTCVVAEVKLLKRTDRSGSLRKTSIYLFKGSVGARDAAAGGHRSGITESSLVWRDIVEPRRALVEASVDRFKSSLAVGPMVLSLKDERACLRNEWQPVGHNKILPLECGVEHHVERTENPCGFLSMNIRRERAMTDWEQSDHVLSFPNAETSGSSSVPVTPVAIQLFSRGPPWSSNAIMRTKDFNTVIIAIEHVSNMKSLRASRLSQPPLSNTRLMQEVYSLLVYPTLFSRRAPTS